MVLPRGLRTKALSVGTEKSLVLSRGLWTKILSVGEKNLCLEPPGRSETAVAGGGAVACGARCGSLRVESHFLHCERASRAAPKQGWPLSAARTAYF